MDKRLEVLYEMLPDHAYDDNTVSLLKSLLKCAYMDGQTDAYRDCINGFKGSVHNVSEPVQVDEPLDCDRSGRILLP